MNVDWDYHDDDYDARDCCDHEQFEIDVCTGRAQCDSCGHAWWASNAEVDAELDRIAAYDEWCRREDAIERGWSPLDVLRRIARSVKRWLAPMNCCGRRWRHADGCDRLPF